ncbi:hypothetical protein [Acinetobacter sp. Brlt_5]|uniref:hypothetical protein n=1 Tax=Acinetobacter sp. Brlt_5 TaxID=3110915 RepID=UPI003F7BA7E0
MTNIIQEISEKLSIKDFNNLSKEEYEKIMELVQNDNFSLAQLAELVKVIPNIVDLQKDYLDSLKSIVDGVKTTQDHSIDGIKKSLDSTMQILSKIADKASSDESLHLIAEITFKLGDLHVRIAEIVKETNKDNNDAWQSIAKFATAAISVVGVALLMALKKK